MKKNNNDPFGFNKAINWKKLEDPKVLKDDKNIELRGFGTFFVKKIKEDNENKSSS